MNDPVNILKERLQALSTEPDDLPRSIYEYICERLTDGHLPEGFGLPPAYTGEKGIMFAPGAMDGIMMYSFGVQPAKEANDLYNALVRESGDKVRAVETALGEDSALTRCDALLERLSKEKPLPPEDIYALALSLAKRSHKKEAVKIGILLLELLYNEGNAQVLGLLQELGACDEFTLWCCFVLRHLNNGNEEIFRLAKKVTGWGKVFIVNDLLEADNAEKRDWLLRQGCENSVMDNYNAMAVYRKCGLENVLSERSPESFDEEEVTGLSHVALGLCDEEPFSGASALDDPEGVLGRLRQIFALHPSHSFAKKAAEAIDNYEYDEPE